MSKKVPCSYPLGHRGVVALRSLEFSLSDLERVPLRRYIDIIAFVAFTTF